MLSERLENAINAQIGRELYSAYLYLAMSTHFRECQLGGFARWMRRQSSEEIDHATRFIEFLTEREAHVTLQAIEQPPVKLGSALDVMRLSLEHEKEITERIHALYGIAMEEGDFAAQIQLQWFISEQIEEEVTVSEIVGRLDKFGADGTNLLLMDEKLGSRGAAE